MARLFNSQTVINIMQKRVLVPESFVGKKVRLTLQGDGTLMDVTRKDGSLVESVVEEGTVMQKLIFNCRAASGLAMHNERNQGYLKQARAFEKAGEYEKADESFKLFLNATQLSFSIPTTNRIVSKLGAGADISAEIIKITTENGSLLSIDPSTIRVLDPVELQKVTFSFDDEVLADEADGAVPKTASELADTLKS